MCYNRYEDIESTAIIGEKLRMAILKYLGIEKIDDVISDYFKVGYYLKECYVCLGKIRNLENDYIINSRGYTEELKIKELCNNAALSITASLNIIKAMVEIKEKLQETDSFKVIEEAMVSYVYRNIMRAYQDFELFGIE